MNKARLAGEQWVTSGLGNTSPVFSDMFGNPLYILKTILYKEFQKIC